MTDIGRVERAEELIARVMDAVTVGDHRLAVEIVDGFSIVELPTVVLFLARHLAAQEAESERLLGELEKVPLGDPLVAWQAMRDRALRAEADLAAAYEDRAHQANKLARYREKIYALGGKP